MSSFYTTGDLAKLAGVSVRTVQYYDKRGILTLSDVTEGGRRLYVASDLEQLRMICFLRELDFSIDQIKRILAEENAKQVLELLLVEHIKEMKQDLSERKAKLDQFAMNWKALTGASDLNGARFVGKIIDVSSGSSPKALIFSNPSSE